MAGAPYTLDTRLGDLLADPAARAVLEQQLGKGSSAALPDCAIGFGLTAIAVYKPDVVDAERQARLAAVLAAFDPC